MSGVEVWSVTVELPRVTSGGAGELRGTTLYSASGESNGQKGSYAIVVCNRKEG